MKTSKLTAELVEEFTEKLVGVNETKQAIKTAIEGKGQDMTDVPFPQYATAIATINVGKKFTTGTVTFAQDNGNQIITHNLGTIPSFFLMLVKDKTLNFTVGAEDAPKAGIYGYLYFKEGMLTKYFTGESVTINDVFTLEWRNLDSRGLHWAESGGHVNPNDIATSTEIILDYRSSAYKYIAGVLYEWIAIE